MSRTRKYLLYSLLVSVFTCTPLVAACSGEVFAGLMKEAYMEDDDAFFNHLVGLPKEEQQKFIREMVDATLASLKPEEDAGLAVAAAPAKPAAEPQYYIDQSTGRRFVYDEATKDWKIDETYTQAATAPPPQQQYRQQPQYYQESPAAGLREAMGAAAGIVRMFGR